MPTRKTTPTSASDLAALLPRLATAPMPERFRTMLEPDNGLYIESARQANVTFAQERVNRSWSRVIPPSNAGRMLHGLPGSTQKIAQTARRPLAAQAVEPYLPAWIDVEYLPRLVPYRLSPRLGCRRVSPRQLVEPVPTTVLMRTKADEAMRFSYPWCTIGQVFCGLGTDFKNPTSSGSGVLVGRNLMITASHVAPWNQGPGQWWMRFVPGHRAGDEPHGSSYVERFYGTYSDVNDFEASGVDYVICKLYTPLGAALGWMGAKSFGSESSYTSRRYISVGYPGYFGNKPAVEFDIDIDDIDSDGDGLELETTYDNSPFADGWSGGPLWLWENEKPYVVGVLSGNEKDELDPRRYVFGGGGLLLSRIKFGIANFA